MNFIRHHTRFVNLCGKLLHRRCFETAPSTEYKLILEPLTERGIIRVKGDEIVPFLQGLITNDIKHLHPSSNKTIYAMFLNKAGRVMYDVILYNTKDPTKILIECDKNIMNELERHLKLYRVRRKIEIDCLREEFNVWQVFDPAKQNETIMNSINKEETTGMFVSADPRLKYLGLRLLAKSDQQFFDISKCFKENIVCEASEQTSFRLHRYMLGIAEGVYDMPPGKCFPLEVNCDILNGVSFHKGCYIGQELTARVHHTGMIRKRHMPVKLTESLPSDKTFIVQNELDANCGIIYGSITDRALGLLRVENVLKAKKLFINGIECFTERPQWWPKEIHYNVSKAMRKEI